MWVAPTPDDATLSSEVALTVDTRSNEGRGSVDAVSPSRGARRSSVECARVLADLAAGALLEEAELTPKPGLVDLESSGSHQDMDIELMRRSARILHPWFAKFAEISYGCAPGRELRERLGEAGRDAEKAMLRETGGVNTHRGAIWTLGLLVAGAAMGVPQVDGGKLSAQQVADTAGELSRWSDRFLPSGHSHGQQVRNKYGFSGARGEAQSGFYHVVQIGLPALRDCRSRGLAEVHCRLDTLLAIMASLDDSCLLHRGGTLALARAKQGAKAVLAHGGSSAAEGWDLLKALDRDMVSRRISPGGSADLLAATLFLDSLMEALVQSQAQASGPQSMREQSEGNLPWSK